MFEVGVVTEFDASHALNGDFGPASNPHGHRYRLRVSVGGSSLRDDGTLCDLAWLAGLVDEVVASLRDRDLNMLELFASRNPTAEVVAWSVHRELIARFSDARLEHLSVEVWESPEAYARYEDAISSTPRDR